MTLQISGGFHYEKEYIKKAMAVMISATMLVTGYTVVSAEGFTDAEALAEMDAFTTGDEAVYVEEVQPEAAQIEEVQPEQTQTEVQPEVAQTEEVQAEESKDEFQTGESAEEAAFVDGFTDSSAEADPAEFTDGTVKLEMQQKLPQIPISVSRTKKSLSLQKCLMRQLFQKTLK